MPVRSSRWLACLFVIPLLACGSAPSGEAFQDDCDGGDCPGSASIDGGARTDGQPDPPKDSGTTPSKDTGGITPVPDTGPAVPCNRDDECSSGLCNWKTRRCSSPAPDGDPCSRDEECVSALCNWKTSRCSPLGLSGAPCARDEECFSTLCQTAVSSCL